MPTMKRKGLLAYHPSKSPEANALLKGMEIRLRSEHPGFQLWAVGSSTQKVYDLFEKLEPGQSFEIIPLLLFPGQHYQEEVCALFEELRKKRTEIDVRLAPCILERADFIDALIDTV